MDGRESDEDRSRLSVSVDAEAPACDCGLEAAAKMMQGGPGRGRRFWACPRGHRVRCLFFVWIDPDAPQERPRMAPSSAAAPESLATPLAEVAVEQMLQAGTHDGARQAVETRSLTHGLPPPTETDGEARLRSAQEHRIHPAARWL